MDSERVEVFLAQHGGKKCLEFRFPQELTVAAAEAAIREWRSEIGAMGTEPLTVVWDCRRMKGYDSQARRVWQDALQELKARIGTIWMVSGSPFVRLGAMLMGKALSIEIRSVDAPERIGT
jgi:hypothetical protein